MKIVTPSQVRFGTDFPFRDGAEEIDGLAAFRFSAEELRGDRARQRAQADATLKA